ncbi:type 1 glutamine amidotransferase domain-containing protein [Zhihengliuella flava]|uniref:Protease I n=1 Tax=Zhihengliuella flava TaxID=1285193 RepID=A0A931DCG4_9MICC|nr:type 1 glutamine amidotransferase domain-containing protein [Zhihengliuella flava]MBG6084881.1 protease I [Zhihengliuella flava]
MASASNLTGRKVLIITTNYGTESDELTSPAEALRAAGADVTIAAPEATSVQTLTADKDPGPEVPADATLDDVDPDAFDALVIPGGTLNADQLRVNDRAQGLAASIAKAGKPVAAICHGPWLLIEAGLASGKRLTSYPSLATDLKNDGATWVDEQVVVDSSGGFALITSRNPGDLDAFNAAIIEQTAGAA